MSQSSRKLRVFITALAVLCSVISAGNQPAVAATPAPTQVLPNIVPAGLPRAKAVAWSPPGRNTSIVTVPKNTKGDSGAYFRELLRSTRAALPGSTITVSTRSLGHKQFVKELIAAKRSRGVHVQFHASKSAINKGSRSLFNALKKALGTNVTNVKKSSFLNLCTGSCNTRANVAGFQHAKFVLFDKVKGPSGTVLRNIAFVSSGNLTNSNQWNHTTLTIGRNKLYKAYKAYLDQMKLNQTKRYSKPVKEGPYTTYFYPASNPVHPAYTALKQVNCKATPGYGIKGRTAVRIMMSIWDDERIAKRLAYLKQEKNCNVEVAIAAGLTSRSVINTLKKGGVRITNARMEGRSPHTKMAVIDGTLTINGKNKNVHRVISGALNFAKKDGGKNDEVVIQIDGIKTEVTRALRLYKHMVRYGKRM